MKKTLILIALLMPLAASAQIGALVHRYANKFYPGAVVFRDGRKVEYLQVELPKQDQAEISVSNDKKRKQKTVLQSEDIVSVTVWTDEFPGVRNTLYYISADRDGKGKKYHSYWGYPIAESPWGTVYKCHTTYTMDKKTGNLLGDYYVTYGAYNMPNEQPAACILLKRNASHGLYIGGSSSVSKTMSWYYLKLKMVAEAFADNADIKQGILKKKIHGSDIQFVLDEMAVSAGLQPSSSVSDLDDTSSPGELPSPDVSSIPAENGTVGDDE